MPDQPEPVSGSCGVAVICAARDTCKGHEDSFTWTYQDAPQLRAQLMTDIISLAWAGISMATPKTNKSLH